MQKQEKKKFRSAIDADLCKGCGYCEENCAKGVFAMSIALNNQGYHVMAAVNTDQCVGCLSCLNVCPEFAVAVEELG